MDPKDSIISDALETQLNYFSLTLKEEQLLLFTLIASLRPSRILEIGFRRGGSSWIMKEALRLFNVDGHIISIDVEPLPVFDLENWGKYLTVIEGVSWDSIPEAERKAGGKFDFCFIDGNHLEYAVEKDLLAIRDAMNPGAVILLHDAWYDGARAGIARACEALDYIDCGIISVSMRKHKGVPTFGVWMLRIPGEREAREVAPAASGK